MTSSPNAVHETLNRAATRMRSLAMVDVDGEP